MPANSRVPAGEGIVKLRHSRKLQFNLRYHFTLKVPVVRGEGREAGFPTNEMIPLWLAKNLLKTSEQGCFLSFSLSLSLFLIHKLQ